MKYIEGITLLETIEMQTPILRILGIIFGVIAAVVVIWLCIRDESWIPSIIVLLLDVFMITVCVFQLIEGSYFQYKIRIDDYSALPSIVEEYEIIKSERDIWYLEEKEK